MSLVIGPITLMHVCTFQSFTLGAYRPMAALDIRESEAVVADTTP